jgi:hypothetical protein
MRATLRTAVRATQRAQGVVGVLALVAAAFLLWGIGWALLVLGVFLLLGAWGSA